ncbi:hypothetical protein D3C87_1708370 [compost metagenome]
MQVNIQFNVPGWGFAFQSEPGERRIGILAARYYLVGDHAGARHPAAVSQVFQRVPKLRFDVFQFLLTYNGIKNR